MPYRTEWVEPDVFVEHKGVTVYRTYKDDNVDQGERTHHFTTDELGGDYGCDCGTADCGHCFDVRELPNWTEPPHPPFLGVGKGHVNTPENMAAWQKYHADDVEGNHIRAIIREAIEKGWVKA